MTTETSRSLIKILTEECGKLHIKVKIQEWGNWSEVDIDRECSVSYCNAHGWHKLSDEQTETFVGWLHDDAMAGIKTHYRLAQ